MAFMMPVMKNDWDIYKTNRSRHTSEGSNSQSSRSRKISECKSESGGARSPAGGGSLGSPAHRSVPAMMNTAKARPARPVRSLSCSPPAAASPPVEKFHTRLVDRLKRSIFRKGRSTGSADDERSS